ncbi:AI-2E family transporter [Haloterrigena alkaliphila]|uniref:AI-2E family transporter n=1 Tax=Haloterrigena alkaliphila TaxID=2816475 RepID=A0A8A2VHU6_9EURY|nr:AI-2E family transporter [Haloterrigena alkaliphila]QSW97788.1 AI-2E family transporter [Haloterrigena alkaliphila]
MNLSKGYLLTLVGVFTYLSWLLVEPFVQYVLAAVLLAFVLYPLQKRLERRVSPTIASFLLLIFAFIAFLLPFAVIVALVAEDAARILEDGNTGSLGIAELEEAIQSQTGVSVDLVSSLTDAAQGVGTAVLERSTAWFGALTHAIIGLGLAFFLIYYLLKDGDELMAWLRKMSPLPADVQDELYTELSEVMWAVLAGHVLIAIVQGAIAGLGLFATGIPSAAFWTFIMIILALIPLIGTFLIWGPAVAYLVVTGEPALAVALAVYSTIIVGISDDYLRPIVVDRYAQINPAVIILGVLGGVYAFGVMGLFFGPVVLGALLTVVRVVDENYDRLEGESGTTET